jgi:hypothetical protein
MKEQIQTGHPRSAVNRTTWYKADGMGGLAPHSEALGSVCYWKDWKLPRKRRRMLIKLGVSPEEVKMASRSRKGYWRMSQNSLVRLALNNTYLANQEVPSMRKLWVRFKYGDQAKV